MDFTEFTNWLCESKSLGARSARDVVSRLRRAMGFLKTTNITATSLNDLKDSPEFLACSMTVKSQLRRAVTLYIEYLKL